MIRNIVPLSSFIIFFFLFLNTHAAEPNWKPAKNGDKIILIRHSKAPGFGDPPGFKIKDCKTQRNLSKKGIDQSKTIGKIIKKKQIKIDVNTTKRFFVREV